MTSLALSRRALVLWAGAPSYLSGSTGTTGHAEVVQVLYDQAQCASALLDVYWKNVDATRC